MGRQTLRPFTAFWLALVLFGVAIGPVPDRVVAGADRSEPMIRALFLYSFARFTDWPTDALPSAAPMRFCVGSALVAVALEATVAGRLIDQHALVVVQTMPDTPLRSCQIVDLSGLDVDQARQTVSSVHGASVLSISDLPRFTAMGGVARVRVEDGRIRLTINLAAAGRARLRIDSRLLNLATIVGDGGMDDSHAGQR